MRRQARTTAAFLFLLEVFFSGSMSLAGRAGNNRGAALFRARAFVHRQIRTRAPFGPGAVVKRLRRFAECIEREPERGGGDTGAASGDHGLVDIDAGLT